MTREFTEKEQRIIARANGKRDKYGRCRVGALMALDEARKEIDAEEELEYQRQRASLPLIEVAETSSDEWYAERFHHTMRQKGKHFRPMNTHELARAFSTFKSSSR